MLSGKNKEDYSGEGFPRRPETRGLSVLFGVSKHQFFFCCHLPSWVVRYTLESKKHTQDIHPDVSCKKGCATSRNAKEERTFCFGLHLVSGFLHHVFATHSAICLRHCDLTELIEKCGFKRFLSSASGQLFMVSRIVKYTESGNWYLSIHSFRQCRPSFWRSCKICNLGLQILGKAQG